MQKTIMTKFGYMNWSETVLDFEKEGVSPCQQELWSPSLNRRKVHVH